MRESIKYSDTRKLLEINDVLYKINRQKAEGPTRVVVTYVKQMEAGHYVYGHSGSENHFFNRVLGFTLFKTKEEAEKELDKIRKCALKRKLMKEYEAKLNKEMGIENHFIIK